MPTLLLAAVLALDVPPLPSADTVRAVWLADLDPATVKSGIVGMFVFVPGSRPDDVAGFWQVEAEGPPSCLRVVAFHPTEDDTGLDVVQPVVV